MATVLSFIKQTASSTVAKDIKSGTSPWEAIRESIGQLVRESSRLLPLALEGENVLKGKLPIVFLAIVQRAGF
jgi:dynactin 1